MAISQHELETLAATGIRHEIERLNALLETLDGHRPRTQRAAAATPTPRAPRKRRKMSAAARQAVSARMKAMWAAKRRGK